jgi:fatty acid desaturase
MGRPLAWNHLATHLLKLLLSLAVLVLATHPILVAAGAVAFFLAGFAFTHDVSHGALGLPRRLNEWTLALAALTNLVAGHAMRRLHARHHARPLASDDVEGEGATVSFRQALLLGPRNALRYRCEGLAGTRGLERTWILGETAASLVLAAAALLSHTPAALIWVGTCIALQATMSLWASHLPHRPPAVLVALARHLEWTHSAVVASFLHHDAHHRRPGVPCGALPG